MRTPNFALTFVALSMIFFLSCNSFNGNSQTTDTTIHKNVQEIIEPGGFNASSGIKFDSTAIKKFLADKPLFKQFSKDFDTFYRANNYNYVWYDKNGLIEFSSALISGLSNIEEEGVTSDVPYKDTLELLFHNPVDSSNLNAPDLNTELMLTGEYFYYAQKVWAGEFNNKAESINWYLPRKKLSYAALLDDNLKNGSIGEPEGKIAKLHYETLKQALAKYREIDKSGNEVVAPLLKGSAVIKPGNYSPVVSDVRKRLMQLGVIKTADTSSVFDANLAGVVYQLKDRYGLKIDSNITNAFINAVNVPAKKRAEQIMVNMERLRWIQRDTSVSKEFILVNIPEYRLVYYENGKVAWRCGVVVGKPMTKTVIFSGDMKYVVFSPYWNVPTSIINKEVKPGMARNKNYLASHNMEWNGGRVRQKPGPKNSLGLVKFLFPNSNNIYLHDTPSKSLFSETNRAFSHGCIRVSQPRELAIRVLRQYPEWTPEKIDAAMHSGKEQYVTLNRTIPVYIGYFTAYVGADGQVNFRNDIYQRDGSLLSMLEQK
jgi:murein L,D-transpeptidase YcbB/YkuD